MERLNVSELDFCAHDVEEESFERFDDIYDAVWQKSSWWKEKIFFNYAISLNVLLKRYIRINIIKYAKSHFTLLMKSV